MRAFAWKKTPALAAAICCAAGIWISDACGPVAAPAIACVAALGVGVAAALCSGREARTPGKLLFGAVALLVATGFIRYQCAVFSGEPVWSWLLSRSNAGEIRGRIASITHGPDWYRYELTAIHVDRRTHIPGRVVVFVRLDDEAKASVPIRYGTFVALKDALDRVPRVRNPSDFDYGSYLRRRGVRAVASVRPADIILLPRQRRRADILISRARNHVRVALSRYVGSDSQPILEALLLGDRSAIDPSVRETFVNTGLVHVLAVSGLHVMIVGFACHGLLGPLLRRFRMRWLLAEGLRTAATMSVLVLYVSLAGHPASAVRAATMTALLLVGPLFRKSVYSLNSLFAAACLILVAAPGSLFDAGFQLSVSAVSGILVLVPRWSNSAGVRTCRRFVGPFVTGNVLVTLAATLTTAPVLLAHFGRMSAAGLLLNLPAIPLTAASLSSAVLAATTTFIPPLAVRFGAAADVSTRFLAGIATFGSENLHYANIVATPDTTGLIGLSLLVLGLLRARRRGRCWRYVCAALFVLVIANVVSGYRRHALGHSELLFFDVGQADAALFLSPGGRTMVVDTGARPFRNPERHPVIVHLKRRSLAVDLLVLTHAHADHAGGTPAILRTIEVRRIVTSSLSLPAPLTDEIRRVADSLSIPVHRVSMGDTLRLDPGVIIQVLGPSQRITTLQSENERSIALRLRVGKTRVLFLGDAEAHSEAAMASTFEDYLESDVIKVAHHGSRTSSTDYFVNRAASHSGKRLAVISVGRNNRYGLPDEDVIERWRDSGYELVFTAESGAIRIRIDRYGFNIRPWR